MRRSYVFPSFVAFALGFLAFGACSLSDPWVDDFQVDKNDLGLIGRNPYFNLEPGSYLVLQRRRLQLTITVLNETKMVDGVVTRVVEARESNDGQLTEVSRNYFAISKRTNDVFCFGEEVDMYKDGKIVNHAGSWLSGVKGAKFGLMMPGRVGLDFDRSYYQERAPGVALDRAEIVSVNETVKTPAGEFTNCVKVKETTPLESFTSEYKYYARGIGLVQDGELKLVRFGKVDVPRT